MEVMIIYFATVMMLAMYCARSWRPQFALAQASNFTRDDGRRTCNDHDLGGDNLHYRLSTGVEDTGPILAPSWPGFLKMAEVWMGKPEDECSSTDQQTICLEEDDNLAAKASQSPKARHELYSSIYDAFHDAGDDYALVLKVSLLSRLPGHKKLVERAFKEARRAAA